jgi:hypothetical protein
MADAYYRSLYFSLNSPEDLKLLGMLLALPRWRRPSAIKTALRQYLPTVLDGPPLGPDAVRTVVTNAARSHSRRPAPSEPNAPSRLAAASEETPTHAIPSLDAQTARTGDPPDLESAERSLESGLDRLMKSRWIG